MKLHKRVSTCLYIFYLMVIVLYVTTNLYIRMKTGDKTLAESLKDDPSIKIKYMVSLSLFMASLFAISIMVRYLYWSVLQQILFSTLNASS